MTFAYALRAIMGEKDVNQSELARRLGVSSQAVNQWVSGKVIPRGKRLERIARALNVELHELLGSGRETPADDRRQRREYQRETSDLSREALEGFGKRLRKFRLSWGLSPGQIAKALSVSKGDYETWETENEFPDLDSLVTLGAVFGISVDWLLFGRTESLTPENFVRLYGEQLSSTQKDILRTFVTFWDLFGRVGPAPGDGSQET